MDGRIAGLVVEGDVAAGHGGIEGAARVADAPHGLRELPHHLGPLGAAEVQAVRDRERRGTGDGDIPGRFRHGVEAPEVGIEQPEAAVSVGGDGNRAHGPLQAHDRCVPARAGDGLALHDRVVLLERPPHARDVRRSQDREERIGGLGVHRRERGVVLQQILSKRRRKPNGGGG